MVPKSCFDILILHIVLDILTDNIIIDSAVLESLLVCTCSYFDVYYIYDYESKQKKLEILKDLTLYKKALKSIVKAQLMEHGAIFVQSLAYCC